LTGIDATVKINTLTHGHTMFDPVFGDMASTSHTSPQVEL